MKFLQTLLLSLAILSIPLSAQEKTHTPEYSVSADIQKQIMCVAKNIYYEAAKESHEGKLAVAQVTINRVNNPNYPSNFCGVVYQKTGATCQFSWTCMKTDEIRDKYAWEECLYIAKRAITESSLHQELAKSRAMFYHATYVSPGWTNMRVVKKIGNHIFYKKA